MTTRKPRNPYRLIESVLKFVGYGILGVFIATLVLLVGWDAAISLGWWALLIIPGIIVLFAIVGIIMWFFIIIQHWWRKKEIAWDEKEDE